MPFAPETLPLRNLDQPILDNTGGLESMWYVDAADVLSVPTGADLFTVEEVVLKPGRAWYQLVASLGTLNFSQPGTRDRHGELFKPVLKGARAKATLALAAGLEAMDGRRFLVLYRDNNGFTWLVGTPDSPLRFLDKYDSGSATARNNYDFTFSGETSTRARPYLGSWTVSDLILQGYGGRVELRTRSGRLLGVAQVGQHIILSSGFALTYEIN